MKESVALLYEGLYELSELAEEAVKNKPFLYEGTGYSATQIIMLEAESEEGFLKRTAGAIDKVKKAAKAGIKELESLKASVSATVPPMSNSADAISAAVQDLQKKMPGEGLLSKLGAIGGGAMDALFGKKDDPVEAVTQIVADGLQFKTMLSNVVKSVIDLLADIEPEAVVDEAAEDSADESGEAAAELTPEQKKKYIDELKELLMNGSINDILTSDNPLYKEVREVTGFSEKDITAALKKSVKPSKWFSGLKSVGASLGIGLGGDLPFKKYGLTEPGIIEDISMVKISDLQKLSGAIAPSAADAAIADELTGGVEQISTLEDERPAAKKKKTEEPGEEGETAEAGAEPADQADQPDQAEEPAAEEPEAEVGTKYVKILRAVPGLKNPDAAGEKLAALLAADVSAGRLLSLKSLLVEKVLRYDDVVTALEDHLPDDESEIPVAIKNLADEMRVELGTEFDIVGGPGVTQEELNVIRKELEALRNLVGGIPEGEREDAIDTIASELDDEFNLSQDVGDVEDLVDPAADLESAIDEIPEEDLEAWGGLPASWKDWLDTTLEVEAEPAEGSEEAAAPEAEAEPADEPKKQQKTKREAGTFWELDKEQSKGEKYGAKGQGPKSKKVRYFRTQAAAEKHSLKTEKAVIGRMRGYILNETNNFRRTSFLSKKEVVIEFYRLGGTNKLLLSEIKKHLSVVDLRWMLLAGLEK